MHVQAWPVMKDGAVVGGTVTSNSPAMARVSEE
jgi:hypothetical protein